MWGGALLLKTRRGPERGGRQQLVYTLLILLVTSRLDHCKLLLIDEFAVLIKMSKSFIDFPLNTE